MEDSNIMKVKKYVPKLPGSKDGTGYNSDTRQVIEPSFVDVQTTVDYDSENFKYGINFPGTDDYQDPLFFFQDPLLPTFDIILDSVNSPLLINGPNSCAAFLDDYGNIYSVRARQKIFSEFKKTLYTLFNADFRPVDRNKSYYINSIAGLDKLTARIVDFEKDKITINLNEDVSMIAAYLGHLYNNLSYSYKHQKQMIPANLLRFNMYIKVHDVRNMPWYKPHANDTGTTTMFSKSYQIYVLRDCSFDFRKFKNFDDTITVGGFDAGAPNKPSTISFDVVYKSIEIESDYPLIIDNFTSDSGSTLKINNKDKDVAYPGLPLNEVYVNNEKLPEDFAAQIQSDGDINNEADGGVANSIAAANATDKQGEAKQNYKKWLNKTSSELGTSNDREKYLKGSDTPKYNTNVRNQVVTTGDTLAYRTDKIENDTFYYNTDGQGNVVYQSDLEDFRAGEVNNIPYAMVSSVYQSDWDPIANQGGHPQTGPALNAWRDSLMGQLNFNLAGYLWSLPITIVNMFMGGYHGLPQIPGPYIDTYARPIGELNNDIIPGSILGGVGPKPSNTEGLDIVPESTGVTHLDGEVIGGIAPPPQYLSGEVIGGIAPPPEHLAGQTISTLAPPPQYLDGEFIPFALHPRDPLTGTINTAFVPRGPLTGYIDTSFIPHPPVSGVIDTSFVPHPPVSGVIDTTARPHPPVSGVIDTSFKPHPPVSGVIDTTARNRVFALGYLYNNEPFTRNDNLGLLYIGVTKDNIVPLTYLYSKVDSFHDLANYYVYNNVVNESKPFNARIDQTKRVQTPFELVYAYDNNVDINNSLNNLTLYNNEVLRTNSLNAINVIGSIPNRKDMVEINVYEPTRALNTLNIIYKYGVPEHSNRIERDYLYRNRTEIILEKPLDGQKVDTQERYIPAVLNLGNIIKTETEPKIQINLGRLYSPITAEKQLLEPIRLFDPVRKKTINLGMLYENENYKGNIFIPSIKTELTVDKILEKKEFERTTIEQNIVADKPLVEKYISSDDNMKDNSLHGDTIFTQGEYKKEKPGLDNERLR